MTKTIVASIALAALVPAAEIPETARLAGAVTKAFHHLEKQSPNFLRIGGCNSCHNQDLPALAQSVARERGIAAGSDIAMLPDDGNYERVFEHSGLLSASNLGYAALSHIARKQPIDAKTDATIGYLLSHQETNGRWPSRSNRQPLTTGDHHATAFGIYTLRAFARPERRAAVDASIARAVAWLQENAPVNNQDAAMQVLGMVWGSADREAVSRASAHLRARQRKDGGWSQLGALESDAYATGQALYALALAGTPASDPSYRQGVEYLLKTQAADGTWHVKARSKPVQPYFESGFPYGHDQWISAAGTSWAAMALAMAVPAPQKSASGVWKSLADTE